MRKIKQTLNNPAVLNTRFPSELALNETPAGLKTQLTRRIITEADSVEKVWKLTIKEEYKRF